MEQLPSSESVASAASGTESVHSGVAAADGAEDDKTLPAIAHSVARRANPGRLPEIVAVGLVGGSLIAVFEPQHWTIGLLGVAVSASALWAMADRAIDVLRQRGHRRRSGRLRMYRVLRVYVLLVAIAAAAACFASGFGLTLPNIGVGGG